MSPPSEFFLSALMNERRVKLDEMAGKFPFNLYRFCAKGRISWDPIDDKMERVAEMVRFIWNEASNSSESDSNRSDSSESDSNESDSNQS